MDDLISKIREYREYKRMEEESKNHANALADEIKAVMVAAGADKMIVGEYKLSYTDCTRKDVDKTQLMADLGDRFNQYIRETAYKRFAVS